jgi:hypothetical protein
MRVFRRLFNFGFVRENVLLGYQAGDDKRCASAATKSTTTVATANATGAITAANVVVSIAASRRLG